MPLLKLTPNDEMACFLQLAGYQFKREAKLIPDRRFAVDFILWEPSSSAKVLVLEVEGITYQGGRHQRMIGFGIDCEKYAELLILGYPLLRVTQKMVRDGRAMDYIHRFFTSLKTNRIKND